MASIKTNVLNNREVEFSHRCELGTILVKTRKTIIYIDSYNRDNYNSEVMDYFWVKRALLGHTDFKYFIIRKVIPCVTIFTFKTGKNLQMIKKWAWIILNPKNANGGMHHIDKLVSQIDLI